MEPDRRSAPLKTKISESDVYTIDQVKDIANSARLIT